MAPWIVAASERWYRRLLAVYPAGLRQEYGPEMARDFRAECQTAYQQGGNRAVIWLWATWGIPDLVRNADARHAWRLVTGGARVHANAVAGVGLVLVVVGGTVALGSSAFEDSPSDPVAAGNLRIVNGPGPELPLLGAAANPWLQTDIVNVVPVVHDAPRLEMLSVDAQWPVTSVAEPQRQIAMAADIQRQVDMIANVQRQVAVVNDVQKQLAVVNDVQRQLNAVVAAQQVNLVNDVYR